MNAVDVLEFVPRRQLGTLSWGELGTELELTRAELLRIRGYARLLDREPVFRGYDQRRNPFVDPLSFFQIEVLSRLRRRGDADRAARAG